MRLDYDKILRVFFVVVITMLVVTNIRQCTSSKSKNQYYIDKLNERSKSEIKKRELHIQKLMFAIAWKDKLIERSKASIDSLERLKGKVQYIYINKVQEINNFNSKQLENYWKDEIK